MTALTTFNFNGMANVRAFEREGEIWFVAKDVAETLGYARPADAIRKHCKGVAKTTTPTSGGTQEVSIIPERDVYRLVMRSKMPEAEKFEDWVVGEVLPSIRKNGGYHVQQKPQSQLDVLQGMINCMKEQEQRVMALESRVDAMSKGEAFFSVVGYANLKGVRLDQKRTAAIGKTASKLCRREGIETGKAPHPVYGEVNTYPIEMLDLAFDLDA